MRKPQLKPEPKSVLNKEFNKALVPWKMYVVDTEYFFEDECANWDRDKQDKSLDGDNEIDNYALRNLVKNG